MTQINSNPGRINNQMPADSSTPDAPPTGDKPSQEAVRDFTKDAIRHGVDEAIGNAAFGDGSTTHADPTPPEEQPGYIAPPGVNVPGIPSKGFGQGRSQKADVPDDGKPRPAGGSGTDSGTSRPSTSGGNRPQSSSSSSSTSGSDDSDSKPNQRTKRTGSHTVDAGGLWGNNFNRVGGSDANRNVNHSSGYESTSTGDDENGTRYSREVGAFSDTGTVSRSDDGGFEVGGNASGSVGVQQEGGFSEEVGGVDVDGQGSQFAGAQGRAYGGAASNDKEMYSSGGFEGRVGLAEEGNVEAKFGKDGKYEVGASGGGMVGAETSNGYSVGKQSITAEEKAQGVKSSMGANGSVGGFAGAKAEGGVRAGYDGNTVGADGALYAGVGAQADGDIGIQKDNKGRTYLGVGGHVGAALGVGGKIGGNVKINITPLIEAEKKAEKWVDEKKDMLANTEVGKVVTAAADTVGEVGKKAQDAAIDVVDGAKKPVKAVADFAGDAASTIGSGVQKVGEGVKDVAEKAGDVASDAVSALNPFD